MKKMFCKVTSFVLVVMMLVGTVSATMDGVRSSLYLDAYRAWLTPCSGGEIAVNIDVQAVGEMDDVGALSVKIYESSDGGTTWSNPRTYYSVMYPELVQHDTVIYYETPIYHDGTPGYKYYAIVKVYAGDETGSDFREYQTTTVTARN